MHLNSGKEKGISPPIVITATEVQTGVSLPYVKLHGFPSEYPTLDLGVGFINP